MKAILLAAGKGSRISEFIEEIPKCTLPINGVPLIRRNIEMLIKKNIEPVVCVGYCKEEIYKALEGLDVKYYINPFFNITNSIASLWLAKDELTEETLIMNADVYFSEKILDTIIEKQHDSVLMVDKSKFIYGDYFFKVENNIIQKFGKDLKLNERNCEYVGIGKIGDVFLKEFKEELDYLVNEQKYDLWWENVLYSFVGRKNIYTLDVEKEFWCEIDYLEDYNKILSYVENN